MEYTDEAQHRLADEQVRAYVGERLAAVPQARLNALGEEDRARYGRLLLACEFINRASFHALVLDAQSARMEAVQRADEELKAAADALASDALEPTLARIEQAFSKRDAAMTAP